MLPAGGSTGDGTPKEVICAPDCNIPARSLRTRNRQLALLQPSNAQDHGVQRALESMIEHLDLRISMRAENARYSATVLCARFISYRPLALVLPVTHCGNRACSSRYLPPGHCARGAGPVVPQRSPVEPAGPMAQRRLSTWRSASPTRLDTEPAPHARPLQRSAW